MHFSDEELAILADVLTPKIMARIEQERPWKRQMFLPSQSVYRVDPSAPFMEYSSCSSRDFFHPEFARIRALLGEPATFHRKYWEWVFIVHHALKRGAVGAGKRGLVFGVGSERLPALFASLGTEVRATDAPSDQGGWSASAEFVDSLDNIPSDGLMDRSDFLRLVSYSPCDMNNIDPALTEFDFCWSSCCYEHLGSLRHGMDFVINSIETLKIGGVAVHTTEFNLSSDEDTVESGPTVLYRRRDFEQLAEELRARGHHVEPFAVAPDSLVIDGYVDFPPYSPMPHLKLDLYGYVSTSAGLVITRGR
jgi:hypothetical protein